MSSNHHPWNDSIQYMYSKYGLGDLLKRLGAISKYTAKRLINLRLRDEYQQVNATVLAQEDHDHLTLFSRCHEGTNYSKAAYLDKIQSPAIRSTFSRIRLNSSKLSSNPYTKVSACCQTCDSTLDFEHIIMKCPLNNALRNKFMNLVQQLAPDLRKLPDRVFYIDIMNVELEAKSDDQSIELTTAALKFVVNSYNLFLSGTWNTLE